MILGGSKGYNVILVGTRGYYGVLELTGYWILVTRYWLFNNGHWILVT